MANLSELAEMLTKRIKDLARTATSSDLTDGEFVAVDKTDGYTRKMTVANLATWIHNKWAAFVNALTAKTSFTSGDKIPVVNGSTATVMGKDDLLRITAQSALAGNTSPEFDPTKPNDEGGYAYYAGTNVSYMGKNYVFVQNHKSGSWNDSEVEHKPLSESINLQGVGEAVDEWLNNHPEATTTVVDCSLTYQKLVNGTLNFVIPEMFGAVGDGVADDTDALRASLNSGHPVYLGKKTYRVAQSIILLGNARISGGTLRIDSYPPASSAKYLFISRDNSDKVIEFRDVVFESVQDQVCYDTRENFFTEVPVSNVGVYHNLVTISSVTFKNCIFRNIDFPVKQVDKIGNLSLINCELTSFVNGIYANDVDLLTIEGCIFKQLPQAALRHHGVYFQGSGSLQCSSTFMDCPNFCIHGWDDAGSNTRDIKIVGCYLSGVSVVCNHGGTNCTTLVQASYLEGQRIFFSTWGNAKVCNCTLAHRTTFPDGTHLYSNAHTLLAGGRIVFANCFAYLGISNPGSGTTAVFKSCCLSLDTRFYVGESGGAVTYRFESCSIYSDLTEPFSIRSSKSSVFILNCVLDLKRFFFYNVGATPAIVVAGSTVFCDPSKVGIPGFVPDDYNTLILPSLQN